MFYFKDYTTTNDKQKTCIYTSIKLAIKQNNKKFQVKVRSCLPSFIFTFIFTSCFKCNILFSSCYIGPNLMMYTASTLI